MDQSLECKIWNHKRIDENIGSKQLDINLGNMFLDLFPKAKEIKAKIKK